MPHGGGLDPAPIPRHNQTVTNTATYDVLFAGGGLASGLTAFAMAQAHPDKRIALVEAGQQPGGNHTWSFHDSDVSDHAREWLSPFVTYAWPGQEVRFPARHRHLHTGYRSISSDRFAHVLAATPGITIHTDSRVTKALPDGLTFENGTRLTAPLVFDGRGPRSTPHMALGFQKFLGLELKLSTPHGLQTPTIMDATVPQTDGYRFVYVLPLTADTLLIEDTYYADGADLPRDDLRREIHHYAAARGWDIAATLREENGILPIVLDGDIDGFWRDLADGPAPLGLRAGLFHPVTGYSVPDAVALADCLAEAMPETTAAAHNLIEHHARTRWRAHGFYRLLNRMLFRAAAPQMRYKVLERFYGLPATLIERFYAGQNTIGDKVRLLAGKPPVPLAAALRALPETRKGQPAQEGLLG